jgi:hypothetical protein
MPEHNLSLLFRHAFGAVGCLIVHLAHALLVNYFSVISAFKSFRVWWKLFAGLFFVCAAVERAVDGGGTPGPCPTVQYALGGSGLIFDGFRSRRKALNSKPR